LKVSQLEQNANSGIHWEIWYVYYGRRAVYLVYLWIMIVIVHAKCILFIVLIIYFRRAKWNWCLATTFHNVGNFCS